MNASVTAMCIVSHFKDDLVHRKLLQTLEDLPVLMSENHQFARYYNQNSRAGCSEETICSTHPSVTQYGRSVDLS